MYTVGAQFIFVLLGSDTSGRVYSLAWQMFLATTATTLSFEEVLDDLGEVAAEIAALFVPKQSDQFSWTGYRVSELDGTFSSGVQALPGGTQTGVLTGDLLPAQTALGLSAPTQQSRRILKKFIPGLTVGQVTANGNWAASTITDWQAIADQLIIGFEATHGLWLWSYNDGKETPVSIIFPHSITVKVEPHVQRRRRLDA
jgi:hypothetical protein